MLRRQTYNKILLSKGYRYSEEDDMYEKNGKLYKPCSNDICSYLVMDSDDFLKMLSEEMLMNKNEFEFVLSKDLDEYEEALALINDFSLKEYGSLPNTSRTLVSIPLAYTTVGDDEESEISVYCNLIDKTVSTFLNRVEVEKIMYAKLREMIKYCLSLLDFDSLVSVKDEWLEKKDEKGRAYIKDHNERLSFMESIHLVSELVKKGFLENDYSEENRQRPEDRVLIYREGSDSYPEGWYSENILSVASELTNNPIAQKNLWKSLEDEGFEPVFV